jgi:cysteinyl-tRNA synthetase
LIRNTLKYICGYAVKSVMNMTDVGHLTDDGDNGEDKLEKGAKREGISVWDIAHKYEEEFKKGLEAMCIDFFDVMPKATDHIKQQIALVKNLEEKGYTYEVPGD